MNNITVYKVDKVEPNLESKYIFVGKQSHILNGLNNSRITAANLVNIDNQYEISDKPYAVGTRVMFVAEQSENTSIHDQVIMGPLVIKEVKTIDTETFDKIKTNLKSKEEVYRTSKQELDDEYERGKTRLDAEYASKSEELKEILEKKSSYLKKPTLDNIIEKESIF